jgi:hypothetical protein
MSGDASVTRSGRLQRAAAPLAIVASFAYFFSTLWRFVSWNAVDAPYWDLWDVLGPSFRGEGIRAAIDLQHGPVRQGLGAVVYEVSNALTGWNFRAIAFENALILALVALAALELKYRLAGRLSIADALIPPIVFRLSQYSTLVVIPYPAHGIVPLLLVVLGCRALLLRNSIARVVTLGALSLAASYTGFAIFLPPLLAGAALAVSLIAWRAGRREEARVNFTLAAIVVICALPALRDYHYGGMGAIPCPDATPVIDHAAYVVTMLNGLFGIFRRDPAGVAFGLIVFAIPVAAVVAVATKRALSALRTSSDASAWRELVPLLLVAFSLVFAVSSSLGRLCAGGAALNSRYVTLMIPLALGVQLALAGWRSGEGRRQSLRNAIVALWAVVVLAGAVRISPFDAEVIEESVTGKRRWIACVRNGGTASGCNRRAQFATYPGLDSKSVDEKVEFLRSRGLSFFAERGAASPE